MNISGHAADNNLTPALGQLWLRLGSALGISKAKPDLVPVCLKFVCIDTPTAYSIKIQYKVKVAPSVDALAYLVRLLVAFKRQMIHVKNEVFTSFPFWEQFCTFVYNELLNAVFLVLRNTSPIFSYLTLASGGYIISIYLIFEKT